LLIGNEQLLTGTPMFATTALIFGFLLFSADRLEHWQKSFVLKNLRCE